MVQSVGSGLIALAGLRTLDFCQYLWLGFAQSVAERTVVIHQSYFIVTHQPIKLVRLSFAAQFPRMRLGVSSAKIGREVVWTGSGVRFAYILRLVSMSPGASNLHGFHTS